MTVWLFPGKSGLPNKKATIHDLRSGWRALGNEAVLRTLDILVGVLADFFVPVMEPAAALRAGAAEDQPAYQAGPQEHDFLGHEPAGGETEQVDLGEAESVGEGEDVAGESLDGARGCAGGKTDSAVVDEDDFALGGDVVDEGLSLIHI